MIAIRQIGSDDGHFYGGRCVALFAAFKQVHDFAFYVGGFVLRFGFVPQLF